MENLEKGQAQSQDCKTALDKDYQGNAAGAQEQQSHKVPETTFPIRKRVRHGAYNSYFKDIHLVTSFSSSWPVNSCPWFIHMSIQRVHWILNLKLY